MGRRAICWLVALPLAVAGSQAAHALDYRLVAPNADERAHLLAETGHAYLALLPLVLALCTVTLALMLVAEGRRARAGSTASVTPWQFGLMAPALFCLQEHFERLAHDGTFPWSEIVQRSFLVGLALQLPFGLVAFLVARALLRVARAVGRRIASLPAADAASSALVFPRLRVHVPHIAALARGCGLRGPPVPSL